MPLDVKEISRLLRVSEETIYNWVAKGELPASRIGDVYRFNRAEVLEWATARRIHVSPDIFAGPAEDAESAPSIAAALELGGIHHDIGGSDRGAVLKAVVGLLPLPGEVDRTFLLHALLARESLGSTGIGDGIAIPHVRNPIVLHVRRPLVTLCFLAHGIDFGALDGKPVDTLFVIVSNTVRTHLHVLARLSYLLSKTDLRGALAARANREQILATVRAAEQSMTPAPQDRRAATRTGP
jgi:PTS system nitrogen regulatory IIA component